MKLKKKTALKRDVNNTYCSMGERDKTTKQYCAKLTCKSPETACVHQFVVTVLLLSCDINNSYGGDHINDKDFL